MFHKPMGEGARPAALFLWSESGIALHGSMSGTIFHVNRTFLTFTWKIVEIGPPQGLERGAGNHVGAAEHAESARLAESAEPARLAEHAAHEKTGPDRKCPDEPVCHTYSFQSVGSQRCAGHPSRQGLTITFLYFASFSLATISPAFTCWPSET